MVSVAYALASAMVPWELVLARSSHILIVDDDQQIRAGLGRFLATQGLRVSQAKDGEDMFKVLATGNIDLIVLDVMLPGEDGLSLCRRLRGNSEVPILLLTAVSGDTDRIVGLELGADDYVCKPFQPRELLARIRAVLRRVNSMPPGMRGLKTAVFRFLGWSLDVQNRALTSPAGELVELTTGEFELLHAFAEHPQTVLSREQLLDLARGRSSVLFDRSIDVQVLRLRRKIETDPQQPSVIKTVRNSGYLFTPIVETDPSKAER
jgi:two-component system OmpR family response regulator